MGMAKKKSGWREVFNVVRDSGAIFKLSFSKKLNAYKVDMTWENKSLSETFDAHSALKVGVKTVGIGRQDHAQAVDLANKLENSLQQQLKP